MKYWLVRFEERNGERTYTKSKVAELENGADIKQWVEAYLKDYYGSNTRKENGAFYSPDGEVSIKLDSTIQITEEEYWILKKFLF